jgi:hypothetical protein
LDLKINHCPRNLIFKKLPFLLLPSLCRNPKADQKNHFFVGINMQRHDLCKKKKSGCKIKRFKDIQYSAIAIFSEVN